MLLVATQWGMIRRFESQSGLGCARTRSAHCLHIRGGRLNLHARFPASMERF